ncbi:molecular chaperone [Raoultella terrigena]|jgi:P pilus assembly chaperone PapD|uniref:Chaperone protein papD n=1 Tax=Raoultella terrigena TaxID=577 RepID=A0A485C8J2_RAOTE|nr:molecular chaperone [Raoultella terrigena]AJF74513.1 pilus assembly protein [Raoultella ornithinolytica]QIT27511.1 molecular chaperone [Raoultella terrigena]ROS22889.1 P pilus assembly chaperone PapD [Raoultella terrigena]WJV40059.1 molecular chaperone [Raoultella terrigena]VFS81521.1 Chaperone protein papD precursor [Raoultella terrigena]
MKILLPVLFATFVFQAQGAIQVEASRVIYSGKERSASLKINNPSSRNYIVQTWLDNGTESPNGSRPIIVTPPLVKLRPEQSALLRFIYSGSGLPTDRETLYWVNVQEVPPSAAGENVLQIAIRTRLKLFYRPQEIKTTLADEVRKMQWTSSATTLTFNNNGPLHITLSKMELADNKGKTVPINGIMLSPYSHQSLTLPAGAHLKSMKYINDHGASIAIPVKR